MRIIKEIALATPYESRERAEEIGRALKNPKGYLAQYDFRACWLDGTGWIVAVFIPNEEYQKLYGFVQVNDTDTRHLDRYLNNGGPPPDGKAKTPAETIELNGADGWNMRWEQGWEDNTN